MTTSKLPRVTIRLSPSAFAVIRNMAAAESRTLGNMGAVLVAEALAMRHAVDQRQEDAAADKGVPR